MCKASAVILAGVVAFFFAWLCVFFIAGDVDVLAWKVENRFLSLIMVLSATFLAVSYCSIYYKNK